jgi:hypothetical protein
MTRESRAAAGAGDLRWGAERRLAFLDDRLFWLGQVNRGDLVDRFAISMSQASLDIAQYLTLNPKGVDYDKSAKRYVARPAFRPVMAEADAGRYLGELRLLDAGLVAAGDTLAGEAPPFAATPLPERRIDPFVLRTLVRGIRGRLLVDTMYQSMSRPRPARRIIEPHALAFDGFRWHARAFDQETREFRDFVLGRISKASAGPVGSHDGAGDYDWQTMVDLVIAPHPSLNESQARAIALDYGITRGSTKLSVRRALLFYALKRLGLDEDHTNRPANVQQIVLLNRAEIAPLRQSQAT